MARRTHLLTGFAVVVAVSLAGCTGERASSPATPGPTGTAPAVTVVALITAPSTTTALASASAPAPGGLPDTTTSGTVRGVVIAMTGSDGDSPPGGAEIRYPALPDSFDLGPLPHAITEHQGRTDPGAVAAQWAALKVLTSGLMDGPIWPYSVAAHLPALSDPAGQFLPDARIDHVEVSNEHQADSTTASATVAITAADPSGATLHVELWRSDDGYWLVAFADPQP